MTQPEVEVLLDEEEETPPKDNNERVERLLSKLEQCCKLLKVDKTVDLRFLDDFDLHTGYKEDQIKRIFVVRSNLVYIK